MSYAQVLSLDIKYNLSRIIRVEVDTARGFHSFGLVGLAHKSISEAKDRVSAAIKNCGYISPKQRNQKIVVSLAPAHIHKEGTHFDLAIALGYLRAIKEIPGKRLNDVLFIGELGLNGEIRPVKHVLSAAKLASKQKLLLIIPEENANELKLVDYPRVFTAKHISEVIAWAMGETNLKSIVEAAKPSAEESLEVIPFTRIQNQPTIPAKILGNTKSKIALALSIIGGHHMCLYGPAGTGKTSLINWLRCLLPPITNDELLEVSEIKEYFLGEDSGSVYTDNPRPFRAPHHNITLSKFIGGGNPVKAGEATLAHRGILFMDEFIEFNKDVINNLREPLENKEVLIHTGSKTMSLPTDFTLVCATNLCHCGNYGSAVRRCHCDERLRRKYLTRLPGPIIDRIPIWSLVDDSTKEGAQTSNIDFTSIRDLVDKGLSFKKRRLRDLVDDSANAPTDNFDEATKNFLDIKAAELNLSRRQINNYAKLGRTVADLNEEEVVSRAHLIEALEYTPKIRTG